MKRNTDPAFLMAAVLFFLLSLLVTKVPDQTPSQSPLSRVGSIKNLSVKDDCGTICQNMKFNQIFIVLIIILSAVCVIFGQHLKLDKKGQIVRVRRDKQLLYSISLRGVQNRRGRKYDQAFLAGNCLLVKRDVREIEVGTEIPPKVSRLEIYRPNGQKSIYRESDLEIQWVDDYQLINSPDFTWAIIPDSVEGVFWGYFHISPDCRLTQIKFPEITFAWGDSADGIFIDAATLKFPSVTNRLEKGPPTKIDIFITKDGQYRLHK
jgi:hypothetical protein